MYKEKNDANKDINKNETKTNFTFLNLISIPTEVIQEGCFLF